MSTHMARQAGQCCLCRGMTDAGFSFLIFCEQIMHNMVFLEQNSLPGTDLSSWQQLPVRLQCAMAALPRLRS